MNYNEQNEIAILLSTLSEYYGRQMARPVVMMMVEDLMEYSVDQIKMAVKKYRQDKNNTTFPIPAKLIAIMNPQTSEGSESIVAATEIINAITNFGWSNAEQAKDYLGELSWRIVETMGGWTYLCENMGSKIQIGTFQAQARDLAKSLIERKKAGLDGMPAQIEIQKGKNEKIAELFKGNDMKQITGKDV